jgi:cold shock CspA family protein
MVNRRNGLETAHRETGTVTLWMDTNGYGRIRADNGDILWTHFADELQPHGVKAHRTGHRVEFTRVSAPGPDGQRTQARNVLLIDKSGKPAIILTRE